MVGISNQRCEVEDINIYLNKLLIEPTLTIPIPTLANEVYYIQTNEENYYLKIFTDKNTKKIQKLVNIYNVLPDLSPKVISYSLNDLENPYILLLEIKGMSFTDYTKHTSQEELEELYVNFGKTVATIHAISFTEFGGYDGMQVTQYEELQNSKTVTKYGPFQTWKDMHKQIIKQRLEVLEGGYFKDILTDIKTYFHKHSAVIDYKIIPRLLHGDLNQKNVFVQNNQISGIIDFDDAFIGHTEEELMRIEGAHFADKPLLKESFFKGYTSILSLDGGFEQRRPFYYLSRLLVHMGCIQEFKETYVKDIDAEVEKIIKEVRNIIEGKGVTYTANG